MNPSGRALPMQGFPSGMGNVLSAGGAAAFSIDSFANLLARYKASGLNALTDNDPISTWADVKTTYDMTGTLTTRPLKKTVSTTSIADFDGTNDFVINATLLDTMPLALTFFAVVRWTGNTGSEKYIFSRDAGGAGMIALTNHSDEKLRLVTTQSGAVYKNVYSAAALTVNVWYIVAGVWNGVAALTNYVNGTLATGDVSTALTSQAGNAHLGVYVDGASAPLNGDIADFAIFNAALSTADLNSVGNALAAEYAALGVDWVDL